MSERQVLLMCPDCGGILESSRPAWLRTIDVAAALADAEPAPTSWRCLICGYDEPASEAQSTEDAQNLTSF